MASPYLGKMCVYFLELPFLICNEKAVFLFENNYNKEKGSLFALKVVFLLCLVVALIF